MDRRAVIFANLSAGRLKSWLPQVINELEHQGIELFASHFSLQEEHVAKAIERAHVEGVCRIIAAGGDGTVGAVLRHLVYTDLALGVVPAGTSNDFVRLLGIPMSVSGSIGVIAADHVSRVDVGEAGGVPFGHAAVVGINTEFSREANRLRPFLGCASCLLASLRVYFNRKRFKVDLRWDGKTYRLSVVEIAFVNAPLAGGPLELDIHGAGITDGQLHVLAVQDVTVSHLVRSLPALLIKRTMEPPGVWSQPIQSAHVVTDPSLPVTVDGEEALRTPFELKVLSRALCVFTPPSTAGFGNG